MELRPYQNTFTTNLAIGLSRDRKVCAQLATGGGKTVIFSAITSRFLAKGTGSVLILVHRKELMLQTRKTLYNMYGLDSFLIVAGVKYIPPAPIYLGMVESVNRRLYKLKGIKLVIIDEAHIDIFKKMNTHFHEPLILGFTATPYSSSKKDPMKNYYDSIVTGPQIKELIHEGFLAQNITRAPKDVVDRANLTIEGGEFTDESMVREFSKPRYVDNTVTVYEKWCKGEKTIVFNVNMSHSRAVCEAFLAKGYNCKYLDSTMSATERANILRWYQTNNDAILCNVGIATVGFDEPTIRNVIVNKSTMSVTLWIQMCGRGGRTTEFKSSFNIIDMGGNAVTHGDWSDDRDWAHVFYNPPKPGNGGIAPCKTCPKCDGIVPAGAHTCKLENEDGEWCGYEFPARELPIEEELADFVIVTKDIDVEQIMRENAMRKEYYTFFKIGNDLAKKAKTTIAIMSDDYFNFILETYYDLGKEWAKKYREKFKADPSKKQIKFNEWHRVKAKEHLLAEMKKHFPKWESKIVCEPFEPRYV